MSKGRFTKKKKNSAYIWMLAVLILALIGLLVFAWYLGNNQSGVENPNQLGTTGETFSEQGGKESGTVPSEDASQNLGNQETTGENTQDPGTQSTTGKDSENTDVHQTTPPEETTEPTVAVIETQSPVEIVEQAKADYERWLASAMIMGITMEYPDFEITGIYLASETTMDNKMDSKGCYILFNSSGTSMALHGVPLAGERTEAGTTDISSQILGYASFDAVDPASVATASMIRVDMEELGELIAQSMLVSIYAH